MSSDDTDDPSKKQPQISSADDLTKTTNKGEVELTEEELKRVTGGFGWNVSKNPEAA
jgi:bacteriocin-like protein